MLFLYLKETVTQTKLCEQPLYMHICTSIKLHGTPGGGYWSQRRGFLNYGTRTIEVHESFLKLEYSKATWYSFAHFLSLVKITDGQKRRNVLN
jgi:hypothetical protein